MTDRVFARKCQECGNIQAAQEPIGRDPSVVYCNSKCRKCKSEALDYGHSRYTRDSKGKLMGMAVEDLA